MSKRIDLMSATKFAAVLRCRLTMRHVNLTLPPPLFSAGRAADGLRRLCPTVRRVAITGSPKVEPKLVPKFGSSINTLHLERPHFGYHFGYHFWDPVSQQFLAPRAKNVQRAPPAPRTLIAPPALRRAPPSGPPIPQDPCHPAGPSRPQGLPFQGSS